MSSTQFTAPVTYTADAQAQLATADDRALASKQYVQQFARSNINSPYQLMNSTDFRTDTFYFTMLSTSKYHPIQISELEFFTSPLTLTPTYDMSCAVYEATVTGPFGQPTLLTVVRDTQRKFHLTSANGFQSINLKTDSEEKQDIVVDPAGTQKIYYLGFKLIDKTQDTIIIYSMSYNGISSQLLVTTANGPLYHSKSVYELPTTTDILKNTKKDDGNFFYVFPTLMFY